MLGNAGMLDYVMAAQQNFGGAQAMRCFVHRESLIVISMLTSCLIVGSNPGGSGREDITNL